MEDEKTNETAQDEPVNEQDNNVDERGVPWQNVAKEAQRKVEEMNERIARIEANAAQPVIQPQPPPPVDYPTRKRTWDEVVDGSPDDFFDKEYKKRRELERKEEAQLKYSVSMKEADGLVHKVDPKKYKENISRVSDVIRTKSISMTDPVSAVKSALEWITLEDKANLSARERDNVQKQDSEKQRVQSIKEKQTTSGTKPPPQKIVPASAAFDRAVETGDPNDAKNFFRSSYFNTDKK